MVVDVDTFLGFCPRSLPPLFLRVWTGLGGRSLSKSMEFVEDDRDELLGSTTVISGSAGTIDATDFSKVVFDDASFSVTELFS